MWTTLQIYSSIFTAETLTLLQRATTLCCVFSSELILKQLSMILEHLWLSECSQVLLSASEHGCLLFGGVDYQAFFFKNFFGAPYVLVKHSLALQRGGVFPTDRAPICGGSWELTLKLTLTLKYLSLCVH